VWLRSRIGTAYRRALQATVYHSVSQGELKDVPPRVMHEKVSGPSHVLPVMVRPTLRYTVAHENSGRGMLSTALVSDSRAKDRET